jgi:hypothetical protein
VYPSSQFFIFFNKVFCYLCGCANDQYLFSGITAEGQGVKVESSAVPSAPTPDVAEAQVNSTNDLADCADSL